MRFPTKMEASDIQVELKYCERCGGLWLRPQGGAGVYCSACRTSLAELEERMNSPNHAARSPRKVPRRRVPIPVVKAQTEKRDKSSARIESLQGAAALEVR
jgi:Zn-finger nucleic acid-binding protein